MLSRIPTTSVLAASQIGLDGVIDIAANGTTTAILKRRPGAAAGGNGNDAHVLEIHRTTAGRTRHVLPKDFQPRTVAFVGELLMVGGGFRFVAVNYEFDIGDYASAQPADTPDEPGVADWPSGGRGEVVRESFRPGLFVVGPRQLSQVTPSGDLPTEGMVASIADASGGADVFVETITRSGLPDSFVLEAYRMENPAAPDVRFGAYIVPGGAGAHETAVSVARSGSPNPLVALQSSSSVRFVEFVGGQVVHRPGFKFLGDVPEDVAGFTVEGDLITVDVTGVAKKRSASSGWAPTVVTEAHMDFGEGSDVLITLN